MESIRVVTPHKLSLLVRSDKALIIDSRTFCEYNTCHILNSINVWSSKIRKKRLQQDSISVHDYLQQACQVSELDAGLDIIVYDQNAACLSAIPQDSFLHVLLNKLGRGFPCVYLLAGGFLEFQARFPELCEDSSKKCTPLTTQSQPCLPVSTVGPTRILPFLYLGSQHDATNRQLLSDYNILYEVNVSVSCPKPDFVQESHFMRIPVNDNFSEKLFPYFTDAFNFIDKVRESGGSVLVHCLAGISRSATVAIAYVMKHLSLPFDEAYMYVKTRRPTISPNINFVGQLAELDRQLRREAGPRGPASAPILFRTQESHHSSSVGSASSVSTSSSAFTSTFLERHACAGLQSNVPKSLSLNLRSTLEAVPASPSSSPHTPDMSPSTALARLSFASALDELRDDGMPLTRSSPVTPISNLPPSTPKTTIIRETTNSPIFSFRKPSESSPSSPAFSSFFKSKEVSSRTSSDYKSEAKITSLKETFSSSDSIKSTSGSTSNYYSSATFNVGAAEAGREIVEERGNGIDKSGRISVEERGSGSVETGSVKAEERGNTSEIRLVRLEERGRNEKTVRPSCTSTVSFTRRGSDRESRQVSVCVIDVKRDASPVTYVRSEPIIVRETQVIATPCNAVPEVRSVLEVQLEDGKQKEEYITIPDESRKLLGSKKGSSDSLWSPLDEKCKENEESIIKIERCQPKHVVQRPREVIVPIQLTSPREERPRVLELSISSSQQQQHPVTATAACTAPELTSGVWLPESPQEAAVAGPPAATPNSPNSPGVQQSDSGIIIEEERTELAPSPQRLPRCYSSSETHLNTRRLLEHRNPDFTTRKCSSYDEVGRAWPQNLGPHHQQQGVGREGPTWLCPWELARSDSVSTSGFGSEISDTDFLHDDANSTTAQDDALGPYDAVFADVFPGDQQQQPRQPQPTTPKTPRPASLPGVTGAYFSQFEANNDPGLDMGVDMGTGGVELRRGGRGRVGVEKKDSGYYSFISEHPPVSPRTMGEGIRHTTTVPWPKERPRDLRLQITNVLGSPTHDSPKITSPVPHIMSHNPNVESRASPEKRMTPEKRKIRGSSTEENEEKRRSCEAETHQWTPPRQPITIGSGVRMAQELLRGVEQLLDSEMGELRRRTAAMSSRIRLLGRSDSGSDSVSNISSPSSSSGNSSASGRSSSSGKSPDVHTTHIIVTTLEDNDPSNVKSMKNIKTNPLHANKYPEPAQGTLITSRARSEPPFPGEEGLYRARSCPGLPRPNGSCEGNEKVSALLPDLQLVRLRGSRPQASQEKFLNRYSCGALDAHQPTTSSSFESCPDFGNLRQCVREGDSLHSSSSSLSSTHSSFTRLLQVS